MPIGVKHTCIELSHTPTEIDAYISVLVGAFNLRAMYLGVYTWGDQNKFDSWLVTFTFFPPFLGSKGKLIDVHVRYTE